MPADRVTIVVEVRLLVEVEPMHDAEARPKRRRQQPRPRRRADERERLQRHLHRSRARPLTDDDVELEVLHRRIEDLFDRRAHPVDFVDEEHLARLQVRQDRRQIAGPFEHRPRRRTHRHAKLVADHIGQRRLAEPGRTVEQHVIERLAALPRRGNRHVQVLAHAFLADVVVERPRPQTRSRTARRRRRATRCSEYRSGQNGHGARQCAPA